MVQYLTVLIEKHNLWLQTEGEMQYIYNTALAVVHFMQHLKKIMEPMEIMVNLCISHIHLCLKWL